MRSYILKKEAKRRNYVEGTGGGPPSKIYFSTLEEEVLEFLTPEVAGLQNIPEGGILETIEQTELQNVPEGGIPEINKLDTEYIQDNLFIINNNETEEEEMPGTTNVENISSNITKKKKKVNTFTQNCNTSIGKLFK